MDRFDNNVVQLKKGHYLAPEYQTHDFEKFLIGITNYQNHTETGIWHYHENPMISLVLYGNNTEYRKGNSIERASGSINFYNAFELHKNIYNTFPSRHISIELSKTFFSEYRYEEADIQKAVYRNQSSYLTFIQLMKEAQINDTHSYASIEMLLLTFLENSINAKEKNTFPDWMLKVQEILHDHWNESVSLQEIASLVNIHPTTISKNFRNYFQCTLGEYHRKLKVTKAISLLATQNYSLTEISYICGFSDQSHFIRVFKLCTGFLPKEFRKNTL